MSGKNKETKFPRQPLLFCGACQKHTRFSLEGNIKICSLCKEKTSFKETPAREFLDAEKASGDDVIYNKKAPEAVRTKFNLVMRRMHKLSDREREVVELLWEGRSQAEVAVILGIDRREVQTYLRRARIKLQ